MLPWYRQRASFPLSILQIFCGDTRDKLGVELQVCRCGAQHANHDVLMCLSDCSSDSLISKPLLADGCPFGSPLPPDDHSIHLEALQGTPRRSYT